MPNHNTSAVVQAGFAHKRVEALPIESAPTSLRRQQRVGTTESALTATLAKDWRSQDTWCPAVPPRRGNVEVLTLILAPLACFGLISGLMPAVIEPMPIEHPRAVLDAPEILAERMVMAESQGDPSAKNKRSTATGAGQFLDQTWLELIRAHRRELFKGRTEKEVLSLRKDPGLSREMTKHFIERNATVLRKRGLPVTPSTLYLAHFAGAAGAVAVLTAPSDADAATVIANADIRAEITRAKILNANPFLRGFTVEDLRNWASIKMEGLATR